MNVRAVVARPAADDLFEAPRRPDAPCGEIIGHYELIELIGRGGMGAVYRAIDRKLRRQVAVKVVARNDCDTSRQRSILTEARAAAQLNHPHVVTIHEVLEEAGQFYIVMELMTGGSAADLVRARGLSPAPATRIAVDACRGLAATHAAGLLHRDVKPANLLQTSDGVTKISDFGLAVGGESCGTSTRERMRHVGTPHYMSPEQCRGEEPQAASDVYSLGAAYFCLLTGRPPFDADMAVQVMFAHCSKRPPDPRESAPDVPEACAAIVRRALAKRPSQRYADATAMLVDLENALSELSAGGAAAAGASLKRHNGVPQLRQVTRAAQRGYDWIEERISRFPTRFRFGLAAGLVLAVSFAFQNGDRRRPQQESSLTPAYNSQTGGGPGTIMTGYPPPPSAGGQAPPRSMSRFPGGQIAMTVTPASVNQRADSRRAETLRRTAQRDVHLAAVTICPTTGRVFAADSGSGVPCYEAIDRLPSRTIFQGLVVEPRGLVCGPRGGLVAAAFAPQGQIAVWDAATGRERRLGLPDPARHITRIAISPDQRWLAAASWRPAERTGVLELWELATARVHTLRTDFTMPAPAVAFLPDGFTLVSADAIGHVQLWNANSGALEREFDSGCELTDMSVSPINGTLAVAGRTKAEQATIFVDSKTGELCDKRPCAPGSRALRVAFSHDGRFVATAENQRIVVRHADTRELVADIETYRSNIVDLAWTPDASAIVSVNGVEGALAWFLAEHPPGGNP